MPDIKHRDSWTVMELWRYCAYFCAAAINEAATILQLDLDSNARHNIGRDYGYRRLTEGGMDDGCADTVVELIRSVYVQE